MNTCNDLEKLNDASDCEFLEKAPEATYVIAFSPGGKLKIFATGRSIKATIVTPTLDITEFKTLTPKAISINSIAGSGGEFVCTGDDYYWIE